MIAAVADHAHREYQLAVAEGLREDVLDAGETAIAPSAEQTAAAAPCPAPFFPGYTTPLLLGSAPSLAFTLLLCSALASKPLALPHAPYLAERSGGGFSKAGSSAASTPRSLRPISDAFPPESASTFGSMANGETICIYCGTPIRKDAKGEEVRTVEHVIGYCLGGALTIPAHKRCNGKANQLVDSELEALPPIGRIRGELGIRSRSGRYVHREVWKSPQGFRAFMYWSEDGRLPKLIPMEIRIDDKNTEILLEDDSDLSKHFEEKRRERVEREGCYLGEPREPTDRPSTVGKEVAILFREPRWSLPQYLWCAAAAKFSLGVLGDGLDKGLLHPSILDLPLLEGLRTMSFEGSLMTELWDPSRFRYEPAQLDATSALAQLHRHEHLLALRKGQEGQSAVLQLVIFGESAYELPLPGLPIERDRAWLFNSVERSLVRLEWADLEKQLNARRPKGAAQLELEIASDAAPAAEQLVAA